MDNAGMACREVYRKESNCRVESIEVIVVQVMIVLRILLTYDRYSK
jgi:hypothetical protein